MNAIGTESSVNASAAKGFDRYVVKTASAACQIRVRAIAPIADVLGFEAEMDAAAGADGPLQAGGDYVDGVTIADLLDSRMIAPPRPRRRRQRFVCSRAVFYGASGR